MKYLLLLTNQSDEVASWQDLSEEDQQRLRAEEMPQWGELFGWIEQRGLHVEGLELEAPEKARTVRVRDGETLVTDGPLRRDEGAARGTLRRRLRRPGRRDRARLPRARRQEGVGGDPAARVNECRDVAALFREEWGRSVAVLARATGGPRPRRGCRSGCLCHCGRALAEARVAGQPRRLDRHHRP